MAYVIDDGAILQSLLQYNSASYANICQLHIQFVRNRNRNSLIVFDGYDGNLCIKGETYQRNTGSEMGVYVKFTPGSKWRTNTFGESKQQTESHRSAGISSGDGNYDIAMSAYTIAITKHVVVVWEGTDVLIRWNKNHFTFADHVTMYLQTSTKLIDITIMQETLDPDLSRSLLFMLALQGCDTTSRPFDRKTLSCG